MSIEVTVLIIIKQMHSHSQEGLFSSCLLNTALALCLSAAEHTNCPGRATRVKMLMGA